MKYDSGSAFRRALEDRLRTHSLHSGIPLLRLRKMVAFDRFLARLLQHQPEGWMLKGGLALQLRLGTETRTTKDVDMLVLDAHQDVLLTLRSAGALDLKDWFSFEVGFPEIEAEAAGGKRYPLRSILDSRPFETFHIDIGMNDPLIERPDQLATPGLLSFADIQPTVIPCYPLTQQIAEKLHAYTRMHTSGASSRVKDFVDLLLMASLAEIRADRLSQALEATFLHWKTHPLPRELPQPPHTWATAFKKLANEAGIGHSSLEEAFIPLQQFLNPILSDSPITLWDPVHWRWR